MITVDASLKAKLPLCYVAFGANIGNREHYLNAALELILASSAMHLRSASTIYQTPPWGYTEQNCFYNACACFATEYSPHELLTELLAIEDKLKRTRDRKWRPRTIDLDLILFANWRLDSARLQLPHPYLTKRAFVLLPLRQIAPDLTINGQSINSYLIRLDSSDITAVAEFDVNRRAQT